MAMNLKMTGLKGFVEERELDCMASLVSTANDVLVSRTGAGNDFLGWLDLPVAYVLRKISRSQ